MLFVSQIRKKMVLGVLYLVQGPRLLGNKRGWILIASLCILSTQSWPR